MEYWGLIQHLCRGFFFLNQVVTLDWLENESSKRIFSQYDDCSLTSSQVSDWLQFDNTDLVDFQSLLFEIGRRLSMKDDEKIDTVAKLAFFLLLQSKESESIFLLPDCRRRERAPIRLVLLASSRNYENQANRCLNNYYQSPRLQTIFLAVCFSLSTDLFVAHSPQIDNPFTSMNSFSISYEYFSFEGQYRETSIFGVTTISPKGLTLQCQSLIEIPYRFLMSSENCSKSVAKVQIHSRKESMPLNSDSNLYCAAAELIKVGVG